MCVSISYGCDQLYIIKVNNLFSGHFKEEKEFLALKNLKYFRRGEKNILNY